MPLEGLIEDALTPDGPLTPFLAVSRRLPQVPRHATENRPARTPGRPAPCTKPFPSSKGARTWYGNARPSSPPTPNSRERELAKPALAATLTQALRERGLDSTTAALAAEIGIAAFKVAYERWVNDPVQPTLAQHMRETLDTARHLTTPAEHAAATDNVSCTDLEGAT
ncbi:hypothetical protein [Streptomyces sp. NPDC056600]|uniref:hypothetical protein n=1 Tax=Streptomyces sp. NPDC056600 TaxID=3345874 RepID=UPI0036C11272